MSESNYPQGKDEVRLWVDGVCDMVAQDLNDLFDIAVAIETELGVEPSGRLGTVVGRLFARGNISKIDGRWRRIDWGIVSNLPEHLFDELLSRWKLTYTTNRWRGNKNGFGEDRPVPFMVLQATSAQYAGWPWSLALFAVEEDYAEIWGRDANMARMGSTRTDVKIAYLLWGMI